MRLTSDYSEVPDITLSVLEPRDIPSIWRGEAPRLIKVMNPACVGSEDGKNAMGSSSLGGGITDRMGKE
jgi:hypothetical protein